MTPISATTAASRTYAVQRRVAHDADEHAHNLSQWQQLYDQLTPGRFHGELNEIWLDGAQVFGEYTSHRVRQSCVVWPNSWWFGVPCSDGRGSKIGARYIGDDMVAMRPGACDFALLTPDDFHILGVVVDGDLLQQHLAEVEHHPLQEVHLQRELLRVGTAAKQRFAGFIQRTLIVMAEPHAVQQSPTAQRALQQALLEHLAQLLLLTGSGTKPATTTQLQRQRLVNQVRDYVLAQHQQTPTVPDLCRRFHVSRRTLQNCFYEVLGLSPAAYLRNLRLNAVRRELKDAHSPLVSVQEVAAAWGFWHLSQFAMDYKTLFGERPSDSLRMRALHCG